MNFVVSLKDLSKLLGDPSLLNLVGAEQVDALRRLFAFLPAKTNITVENGQVLICPPRVKRRE
jgi:hypothetical protein